MGSKEFPAEMLASSQARAPPTGLSLPPAEGSRANLAPTDAVKSSDAPSTGQAVRVNSTSRILPNGASSHSATMFSYFPSLHDPGPRTVWVESKISHPPPLTY